MSYYMPITGVFDPKVKMISLEMFEQEAILYTNVIKL